LGNSIGKEIEGKHVFLSEKYCDSKEKENPLYRVYLATGGFGCNVGTIGSAVFATQVATGFEIRLEGHMLERLATKKEVKAAKQLFEDDPPFEKTLTPDDVQWGKEGNPEVIITEKFAYPVALRFEGKDLDKLTKYVSHMTMPFEYWMNEYVRFVIRDVTYAVEKKQDVDFKDIKEKMTEFAKGWLGSILGIFQTPIEMTIDLDTLTPEKREEFINNTDYLREYFDSLEE
jgi:hypothetical protein